MEANSWKVRAAGVQDIEALEDMERQVWGPLGTEVYDRKNFLSWLEVYPDGFLVLEDEGKLLAFTFAQLIEFNLDQINQLKTFNDVTDHGLSKGTHRNDGNYHFGLTICSIRKGAGRVLLQALIDFTVGRQKPLLGVSRISGFDDYLKRVAATNPALTLDQETKNRIALRYTAECAKRVRGRMRLSLPEDGFDSLPTVDKDDPQLCMYLKNPRFVVYAVLPQFIQDPSSHNFSVLFGHE